MHGGQKVGAVNMVLCHVMWAIISKPPKLEVVSFIDQVFIGHSVLQNNSDWTLLLENWESWSQLIYIQWSGTVGFISSASVGHGTHKLASWPFVMMYEHI